MNARILYPLRRLVTARWKRMFRGLLLSTSMPKQELDPDVERDLVEIYSPDVRILSRLIGRNVPWPRFRETVAKE